MKTIVFLFNMTFFFFASIASAQNLVPNWSFENTVSCPTNQGQMDKALGWSSYRVSPDYFNSCSSTSSLVSIPNNFGGYHYPMNGNAYAGFIVGSNAREFIGIHLNQPLIIGQKYYASLNVCRAGSIYFNRAANKIGICLTTHAFSAANPEPLLNYAQIYTNSIITDTLNWTNISGSFIADSSYEYLSIGNFFNDSLTSFLNLDSIHLQAYYFVDDILLSTDSNCCSGINELNSNIGLQIWPNPAYDCVYIQTKNASKVLIYDLLGEYYFGDIDSNTFYHRFDISRLSKGIYLVNIQTVTQNIIHKLLIQ